jgi:hypothetical protein
MTALFMMFSHVSRLMVSLFLLLGVLITCARDGAKFFRARNADKAPELPQVILLGFARVGVAEISKPLDFGRDIGQFDELRRR